LRENAYSLRCRNAPEREKFHDVRRRFGNAGRVDKAQIAQTLLLDPLNEATSLFRRYQGAPGLRGYIQDRMRYLAPIGALMVLISLACTAATVLYLGGTRSVLVLLAMLIAPFVLFGSLFVQVYVFGSWLEGRAFERTLQRRRPVTPLDMGRMPSVPWVFAGLFLVAPLAMLVSVMPALGVLLILLLAAAPVAFARLDR
jgi:hypothetical protein